MRHRLEAFWEKHYAKCVVICYWLLGLCNNYGYVIMLSAAHDILGSSENKNGTQSSLTTERTNPLLDDPANKTNKYDCNNLSTGAILIADVLPGIVAKFMAPFFMHKIKYSHRVLFVVLANLASFLLVALVPPRFEALIFLGVGFASIASSFGEITFLSMTTLYDRSLSITGWASGTGGAGLVGSFGYAALTWSGLSPQSTILAMLFIPVLMAVSYAFLPSIEFASARNYSDLGQDGTTSQYTRVATEDDDDETPASSYEHLPPLPESGSVNSDFRAVVKDNAVEFLRILCPLLKYMIPLFFVYFAQYFINQGLFELLYFRNDSIIKDHKSQYRWYNVCYQAAVFISRSTIRLFRIPFLPVFPILQVLNVFILLSQIFYGYFPGIWLVFIVIFWEGLIGGWCYVNAFNMVSIEVSKEKRELSMAVVSQADSFGIALAGFISIPVHNAICDYGGR